MFGLNQLDHCSRQQTEHRECGDGSYASYTNDNLYSSGFNYAKILKKTGLIKLEKRKLRADQNGNYSYESNYQSRTEHIIHYEWQSRGHIYVFKVEKPRARPALRKHLSHRTVDAWNYLPGHNYGHHDLPKNYKLLLLKYVSSRRVAYLNI